MGFDFRVSLKISTRQDKKQIIAHAQPAFNRKQEHESKTSVLRIVTLTNNKPMTLSLFDWRR